MNFAPSAAQLRFLAAAETQSGSNTLAEVCRLAQCEVSSYYQWCEDPQFRRWFLPTWSRGFVRDARRELFTAARAQSPHSHLHFDALCDMLVAAQGPTRLQ